MIREIVRDINKKSVGGISCASLEAKYRTGGTRERLLERALQAVSRRAVDSRRSRQPPFFQRFAHHALHTDTYHLEGMVECRLFDEGFSAEHGEVRAAARNLADTSAAGPRPGRPPLRSPRCPNFLGAEEKKVRAQPQLESSRSSSDGCEHSRRLGMFQDVDLRCQLDE
jgi:hypothetical protein